MFELLMLVVFIIFIVKICPRNSFDAYHKHQMKKDRAELRRVQARAIESTWWYGALQLIGAIAVMYLIVTYFNF